MNNNGIMRKIHDNVKNLASLTEYTFINNNISDVIFNIIIYDKKNEIVVQKILNKRRHGLHLCSMEPDLDVLLLSPFIISCSRMITKHQLDIVLIINCR